MWRTLQVAGRVLAPAAAMLSLAAGTLSILDGAPSSHGPGFFASVTFLAPAVLPGRIHADAAPMHTQKAALSCHVDLSAGSLWISSDIGSEAPTTCMRTAIAPATWQLQGSLDLLHSSAEGGMTQRRPLALLHAASLRARVPARSAVSGVGCASTGAGSALPDDALRPAQLDAALHLAATDGARSRHSKPLSVPAAVDALILQQQVAEPMTASAQMHLFAPLVAAAYLMPAPGSARISDHQLDVGSMRCVLSGILSKPLSPAGPTADPVAYTQRQRVADMLYETHWQASAPLNASASAAVPWTKGVRRSHSGVAPLGVRLRASLNPARTALAALPVAAASAAAGDDSAFSLSARSGHSSSPGRLRGSTLASAQAGTLAAIAKTLRLEAAPVRINRQLTDPHAASDKPGTASRGPRLQLRAPRDGNDGSDEHGLLLSGGAGYELVLAQKHGGPTLGSTPQEGPPWRGAVVVTGKPLTLPHTFQAGKELLYIEASSEAAVEVMIQRSKTSSFSGV